MMRAGVLGGTFDPVHLGHVALAKAAIREAALDRLIVMPAGIQPFKQEQEVTDSVHRLAMVRLAFADVEKAEVSEFELRREGVSYTYDTLMTLKDAGAGRLFFVVGTDSFLQLESWHRGKELLREFSLIVSVRPGYREAELCAAAKRYKEQYGTESLELRAEMPQVSSTDIRKRLAAGLDVTALTPPAVEEYIYAHGLYGQNKGNA